MSLTPRQLLLILALFVLTRAALVGVGAFANVRLPANEGEEFTHLLDGGPALDMWYRWDAGFYATIATEGYDWWNERQPSGDMAFLPLYPAAINLFMRATGCGFTPYLSTCATVGGVIVSNLALLLAGVLLFDVIMRRKPTERAASVAWFALLLLFITPNSIFLSGVYTESTFLLLVILTFWLLERQRFAFAVLCACMAALTRSVGVALVPALLWWVWEWHRAQNSSLVTFLKDWRTYAAALPALVFGGYIIFAGLTAGDLRAYFSSYEVVWARDVTQAPWDTLLRYFSGETVSWYGWSLSWLDLAAFLGWLGLAVVVFRQSRTWGIFALFAVLIPFASGTLVAMPRFGAVIFPFYIVAAMWSNTRWKQALVILGSLALWAFFISRFVTWHWIA
jgi:Mannosyltransferase (PIG-V)